MVEINLLPQQYRKQTEPSAWKFATYALLPLTAAAILIPEVMTATTIGDLRRQIDALNGEIVTLSPAKTEYDDLKRQQSELEQVTTIAQQLATGKTYWTNDIAAFSRQLPQGSGVALRNMTVRELDAAALASQQQAGVYVGKQVTREFDLTGTASSQQAVVNFLNTFEQSPNFGVNFRNMQQENESETYSFTATVGVVGTPAGAGTQNAVSGTTGTPGAAAPAPAAPAPAAPAAGGADVR